MGLIKDLSKHIDNKSFQSVYVFTGEELGLLHLYLDTVKKNFKTVIEAGDKATFLDQVLEDIQYKSLFGGGKLYIFKETGLFNKQADDKFIGFLVKMFKQKTNVCIFVESAVNKTLKQTQSLSDQMLIEFKKLNEGQLMSFVKTSLEKNGKRMLNDLTRYFIEQCDYDYNTIVNELSKLLNFVQDKEIKVDHVREIVTRSSKSIVFDLVTHVVKQEYGRALGMYELLLAKKEQPLVILTLIYRQLKLLYQIKCLTAEGYRTNDIADACDSKPFIIEKNLNICNFDTDKLLKLMNTCSDLDWRIKTGQIKDALAIECLILYSSLG